MVKRLSTQRKAPPLERWSAPPYLRTGALTSFKGHPKKLRTTATFLALFTLADLATAGTIKPFSHADFDKQIQASRPVVADDDQCQHASRS